MAWRVDINQFSLNEFLSQSSGALLISVRLVSAIRQNFTGFDDDDDLPLAAGWQRDHSAVGPLHARQLRALSWRLQRPAALPRL